MKILVASHTYIVDLNCEKLRALANISPEIEITVVVPKKWQPGGVQNKTIISEYRDQGNFKIVPISNFSQNHQGLLTFGADLITLLKNFRPQIIQVEQASRGLAYTEMIILNKLLDLKAKNLFFTWWTLPYELKFPVSLLEKFNLDHSDGIIAGNQDGADILRHRGYHKRIKVMPQLGVDTRVFYPAKQPELASNLGINGDDFVIGFVGRFVPEKGLLTLMKSLTTMVDKPWKLLLVGRGELKEEMMKIARENNFIERLIIVESVPHHQVANYINLMSTLVLPSETTYKFKTLTAVGWKEQFGHVLIEAMACKVPVIGSNSGEIPYVIDNAGLVFPEGDFSALTSCLIQLLNDPILQQDIGYKGYEKVMLRYTNQALAQEQLTFYQELISQ